MFLYIPGVSGTIPDHSGHFWKNTFFKNVDFARVTFQFLARDRVIWKRITDMTTDSGSSAKGLVGPRAVWAGVPETYLKNHF